MSHTYGMEKKISDNIGSTKAENGKIAPAASAAQMQNGVFLSPKDAEEYRQYKRRKKLNEIASAISETESSLLDGEDVQRVCERAVRLRQAAVKTPPSKLTQAAYYLSGSNVALDCAIGGTGETLPRVKAYEARLAVKKHAREITVSITPSFLDSCRYSEIRKELKRVARVRGKAKMKVRLENTSHPTAVARVARIACEVGASFFSVPYFQGCERIRLDLTGGCGLEVSGVETTAQFEKLKEAGVGRIVTDRAWEIYSELLKRAEEESLALFAEHKRAETPSPETPLKKEENSEAKKEPATEKTSAPPVVNGLLSPVCPSPASSSETEYRCRLEGTQLKFL